LNSPFDAQNAKKDPKRRGRNCNPEWQEILGLSLLRNGAPSLDAKETCLKMQKLRPQTNKNQRKAKTFSAKPLSLLPMHTTGNRRVCTENRLNHALTFSPYGGQIVSQAVNLPLQVKSEMDKSRIGSQSFNDSL
jgi:hypothetical protein